MTTVEDLKQRARTGDLQALQELRERGFFKDRAVPDSYPVSHAQRRLWIVDQMVGGFGAYNIPIALELAGALDPAALRDALQAVMRRHESLRTTFAAIDGAVRQFIHEDMDLPWTVSDLCGNPNAERQARRIAAEHAARPFDLARGPLLRAGLVRLAPDRHLFLFNIHHIVSDLVSLGVLIQDLSAAYEACAAGRPPALERLPIQYKDFAVWQNRLITGTEAERHRAYWLDRLAGPLPPLELPADFVRPPLKTYACDVCRVQIDAALTERLQKVGLRHGMTLFMVLIATVKLLLYRYTGQEDIVVGFPLAGRDHPELAGQIGCFVNTVALRDRLDGDEPFTAMLGRVRRTMLEAYEHQVYPFDRLVEELDLPRDMSRSPVFDVTVSLANAEQAALRFGDVTISPYDDGFAAAKVDLSFDFFENPDGLELAIAHCTDLFSAERMRRMAGHYLRLTAHAIGHPEQSIGRMPLMTSEEEHRVLVGFNRTDRPLPGGETVVDLIERQAGLMPEAIAISHGDRQLSYVELNRQANRLARVLKDYGIGPETMVGLYLEPSAEVAISLLGILKAGGVYLPLDPANPHHRLAAMLDDARPPVILTQSALADRLPVMTGCWLLLWDDELVEAMAGQTDDAPPREAGPDHAAYAIFTSGSTGQAKAAVLPHRGLVNVAREQALLFGPGPGDRVLQFAALGFDASVFEMVMALSSGATLCLGDREQLLPGAALLATLERYEISIVTLPPSSLAALPEAALPKLRTITVAGEACPAELVRRWAPGRAFFNLYGPTEATIWASAARCEPDGRPPTLGRPIGNTRLYVLDRHSQPVPIGIPGELCIAGVGLARHYLNRPDLTQARFVADPFDPTPGARLYRTGDLARWLPDGTVEFLGRIDHQVKLRGYRIEPGEIETVLAHHPGVRDAVVLARETEPGQQRLVAYATPRSPDGPPGADDLRRFLRDRLPDYMVPARIVLLDEMPLTPNKKIDRKALVDPDDARPDLKSAFVAPRDDLEHVLARWFAEVLRVEKVGIADNFFDLGGDSLMATRIVSQLHDAFRAEVTIPQLFRAATVGALAELVRAALPAGKADKIAIALRRLQGMSAEEKQELLRKRAAEEAPGPVGGE
jgi:amino acid adenylation domain-containing protein